MILLALLVIESALALCLLKVALDEARSTRAWFKESKRIREDAEATVKQVELKLGFINQELERIKDEWAKSQSYYE